MTRRILGIAAACVFATAALAQQPAQMPKPGPEHKRFAYFVGNWTSEAEMKPGPFGAGKVSGKDHAELFPGGFFLVTRSDGKSPMGPMHELAVMGYNAEEKVYTYDGFSNMGEHEAFKGNVEGDTWTWTGESKYQGKVFKGKFILKEVSPTSYTFRYDFSTDGNTWTNAMEGKATKVK